MISRQPFPTINEAARAQPGSWLWARDSGPAARIFLEKRDSRLSARFEENGTCIIEGNWSVGSGKQISLIAFGGSHSIYINSELSAEEKSDRIWGYLEAESATLELLASITDDNRSPAQI